MTETSLDMSQNQLALPFEVTGRFYSIKGTGSSYLCRDLLEIRRRGLAAEAKCDAVFIMMNPGSSEPVLKLAHVKLHKATLVETKPDTTQYQLMRLMVMKGWGRVKVLNLSDLRECKSKDFFKLFKKFEEVEGHDKHSIFSKTRRTELAEGLCRKPEAPVVLAWGVDRALNKLATNALDAFGKSPVLGLAHHNGPWAYRHPLPRTKAAQTDWRCNTLEMLRTQFRELGQHAGAPQN